MSLFDNTKGSQLQDPYTNSLYTPASESTTYFFADRPNFDVFTPDTGQYQLIETGIGLNQGPATAMTTNNIVLPPNDIIYCWRYQAYGEIKLKHQASLPNFEISCILPTQSTLPNNPTAVYFGVENTDVGRYATTQFFFAINPTQFTANYRKSASSVITTIDITSSLPANYDTGVNFYQIVINPKSAQFLINGNVVTTLQRDLIFNDSRSMMLASKYISFFSTGYYATSKFAYIRFMGMWDRDINDIFVPYSHGFVFNTAVTANTNILTTFAPLDTPTTIRIFAAFDTSGVLSVQRTVNAVTIPTQLNSGNSLNANAEYIFDTIVDAGETINFQYSTNATALKLSTVEKQAI